MKERLHISHRVWVLSQITWLSLIYHEWHSDGFNLVKTADSPQCLISYTHTHEQIHTHPKREAHTGVIKRPLLFRWQKWKIPWWITSMLLFLSPPFRLRPLPVDTSKCVCLGEYLCVLLLFDVISHRLTSHNLTHYSQSCNYSYLSLWRQQLKVSQTHTHTHTRAVKD